MAKHHERSILLLFFGLAGLLVSMLAGVWEHFPSIQFLCTAACRDTAQIKIFHVPVWIWGALFWAAVIFLALYNKEWIPWAAAPAFGMEAALVWIMFRLGASCTFCIANALLVLLLIAFAFRKRLFWQQAALALLFLLAGISWIPYENNLFASVTRKPSGNDIAAKIGDETITDHRLEVLLGSRLFDLKKDIYRLKKDRLDQMIVESVLQKEAQEKGKTVEQFLDEVLPADRFTATDSEIDQYLKDNQERITGWQGTYAELRDKVKAFLEQQKRIQAVNAYGHSLERKHGVQVFLPVPQLPTVRVDTQGAPSAGPLDAAVMIIEFSDYECPACRSTHETVKKLKAAYGNQIRWIFKDYPLKRHKDALKAAEAANCAGDLGKFWEYQDLLFTRDKLDSESLVKYAAELGLSAEKFTQCLGEEKHRAEIEKGVRDASLAGVDRTPSFIINGTLLTGGPAFDSFKARIDEELKKAGKSP